ncbi:MAG: hypothetical protein RLZ25_1433 [Pseudomonadota bacterium]|jgi:creatinine amidohydrolase/Fe(II)-dependent formamide hydrolase-like protein/sterol desaturase/sphingolipid hydroxylase (fatty acid hydroxylase superfamily)
MVDDLVAIFLTAPKRAFLEVGQRFYWQYLLTSYLIGLTVLLVRSRGEMNLVRGMKALFPTRVWLSRSLIHDVTLTYLTICLQVALLGTITIKLEGWFESHLTMMTTPYFAGMIQQTGWESSAIATLGLALVLDFAFFVGHYLQHHVSFLWHFHAVHHSAPELNPFTGYRQHPVDLLLSTLIIGILVGSYLGVIHGIIGQPASIISADGEALPVLLFYLFGYHLRHSHVWLDYGPFWDRIFISPAQHQIHHSCAVEHHDRNFGYMLAIWDRLAGSLYVPSSHENIRFGLEPGHQDDSSLLNLLWMPFVRSQRALSRTALLLGVITVLSLVPWVDAQYRSKIVAVHEGKGNAMPLMEDMTTNEIRESILTGTHRVIIPTGGVEQNGPHLVTGKHNYIVRQNAINVAERLGQTLVAPVLAYVPEGAIDPPEGHMRFAGTLSIQEPIFEAILEDTVRSLARHGFKEILIMGDSGGNQKAQERVAQRLNQSQDRSGLHVYSLPEYYLDNHQLDYLRGLGFSEDEIGTHAGIRDTAELLFAHPDGIRINKLDASGEDADLKGSNGHPEKASRELGAALSHLKVETAVREILELERTQ